MEWGWDNGRAIIGLFVITGIAWLLSENKRKFPWKIVVGAVVMMYAFTLLLFGVMSTWARGRALLLDSIRRDGLELQPFIDALDTGTLQRASRTAVR